MSQKTLSEIIDRAATDETFRNRISKNLEEMIRENNWELSEKEKNALLNMKIEKEEAIDRVLDERVSKAIYGTDTHSIMW
jgi:hypothetical protein